MVLRQVALMMVVGGALGLAGAIALGRGAESLLFQMKGSDPVVLASAAVLLVLVALAAGFVPAQRRPGLIRWWLSATNDGETQIPPIWSNGDTDFAIPQIGRRAAAAAKGRGLSFIRADIVGAPAACRQNKNLKVCEICVSLVIGKISEICVALRGAATQSAFPPSKAIVGRSPYVEEVAAGARPPPLPRARRPAPR